MAFDIFAGLPLNQSIASAAWDSGGMAWSAYTLLSGNGADAVKSTQVSPNQGFANYASLDGQVGQAVFFKIAPGRVTTDFAIALYIDSNGAHDQYPPGAGVRVAIGAYTQLALRDIAAAVETSVLYTIADNTEYCLEIKEASTNGKDFRATLYAASGGVRGAQLATQVISLVTALPSTNKRVHLATIPANHALLSISRVESVDGAAPNPAATLSWTEAAEAFAASASVQVSGVTMAAGWTEVAESMAISATAAAATGSITTPVMKNNTGAILANEAGVIVNIYNATTGALVVRKTGQTSNASGVVVVTDALLVAGTSYAYEVVLATNGRRLPVTAAA